jgi:hypothetical protein
MSYTWFYGFIKKIARGRYPYFVQLGSVQTRAYDPIHIAILPQISDLRKTLSSIFAEWAATSMAAGEGGQVGPASARR